MALPEALFPLELVERTIRRIGPGAAHVPDALTLEQQRRLVAGCREWPGQEVTGYGAGVRRHVTSTPDWVGAIGRDVLGRAMRTAELTGPEPDDPTPGDWRPEGALVAHLATGAGMRMHQVQGGRAPVVVLSIGDACRFRLGNTRTPTRPYRDVLLESGDALVFGGPARASFIGAPALRPGTAPDWCGPTEGWLGLALTADWRSWH